MQNQSLKMKKFLRTCFTMKFVKELENTSKVFYQQQNQQQLRRHYSQQTCSNLLLLSTNSTCAIKQTRQIISNGKSTIFNTPNKYFLAIKNYSKFTAATEPPNLGSIPLCEERAHDLIVNLKDSERVAIKTALAKYEALKIKEGYEGKLAATQWRTRFGRLSSVPASTLGDVDPTGTYCAFPDDWLKKKAVEKAPEPTRSDLMRIFMVNAVPFVVFGFLDNFTMIVAGDYIEQLFGYFMCISTMAAAGLGNTLSDILGIGSALYVERGCELMGLKPPDLTPVQLELKSSRRAANYGRMIGITVGCLIGMLPLLFMDKKSSSEEAEKKAVKDQAATDNKNEKAK